MRKINTLRFVIWAWGMLYAQPGVSQTGPHQLLLGAGTASSRHFETIGVWKERVEGGGSTTVNSSGIYHLGYRYTGAGRHSFGILLAAERQNVRQTGAMAPELWGRYKAVQDRYLTVLADYRFAWGRRPAAKWYSGVSPGVSWQQRRESHNDFSYVKDEFSKVRFAYQVTAVGFEFGKKLGGYLELGYGYKGFLSGGLKYGF